MTKRKGSKYRKEKGSVKYREHFPHRQAKEVLDLWKKEYSIKEIALTRQTSERAVRKVLNRLKDKNYLDSRKYPIVTGDEKVPDTVRLLNRGNCNTGTLLHNVRAYIAVRAGLSHLLPGSKKVMLKHTQTHILIHKGVKICVFQNGTLVIYLPEIHGRDSDDVSFQILRYVKEYLSSLEQTFNIRLSLTDSGSYDFVLNLSHYAYPNHPVATAILNLTNGKGITVKDSHGKRILWVDKSKGGADFEAGSKVVAATVIEQRTDKYLVKGTLDDMYQAGVWTTAMTMEHGSKLYNHEIRIQRLEKMHGIDSTEERKS